MYSRLISNRAKYDEWVLKSMKIFLFALKKEEDLLPLHWNRASVNVEQN